ncbi:MAG: hypothetical protein PHO10_06180 [Gemmiger sp.]|nr:hypothetical protein [Gemmiger sp.]
MQHYLAAKTDPDVMQELTPVLAEMEQSIAYLSRLCANAADIALAYTGGFCSEKMPLELTETLTRLVNCVGEELLARKLDASLVLDDHVQEPLWLMADTGLVDALFANLISNSLRACPTPATLRIACLPGREPLYTDNGPGLRSTLERTCLIQGVPTPETLQQGQLGLLLVHQYANALGWTLRPENGPASGFRLRILLPPFVPPAELTLHSSAAATENRNALQRLCLSRELDGTLGLIPPKEP